MEFQLGLLWEEWMPWLIKYNDIGTLWESQPTYLLSQFTYLLAGIVTLLHALQQGGRWPYYWIGALLHGLYADNVVHFILPDYDNFWHSTAPIMLLGNRLPLHIILLYPVFMYQAAFAVTKLNLPRYAEPFAVGLLVVLIDLPYDITAVKFVHWTWHDTDPNIFDRHYWVPWNSYYFHATFAASFYYIFHASRNSYGPNVGQWDIASKWSECKSLFITVLLGMPGGVLMFVAIYHPLHDMYKIHSEVTFFLLVAVYAVFVVRGLLKRKRNYLRTSAWDYALISQLVVHYALYLMFVIIMDPEKEISIGPHEPVGPCDEVATLVTPFGQTLTKRKYLCVDNYNEGYFNFDCTLKPEYGDNSYTICGTPFENRMEYIVVISTICIIAAGVFHSIYFVKHQSNKTNNSSQRKLKTK